MGHIKNLYFEPYFDMYNKCNQIKQIDPEYAIYFNKKDKYFIVAKNADYLHFCMKFNSFSTNIEKLLKKTRVENSRKLFKEIDLINENISKQKFKHNREEMANKIIETKRLYYSGHKVLQSDINKIIGVKDV